MDSSTVFTPFSLGPVVANMPQTTDPWQTTVQAITAGSSSVKVIAPQAQTTPQSCIDRTPYEYDIEDSPGAVLFGAAALAMLVAANVWGPLHFFAIWLQHVTLNSGLGSLLIIFTAFAAIAICTGVGMLADTQLGRYRERRSQRRIADKQHNPIYHMWRQRAWAPLHQETIASYAVFHTMRNNHVCLVLARFLGDGANRLAYTEKIVVQLDDNIAPDELASTLFVLQQTAQEQEQQERDALASEQQQDAIGQQQQDMTAPSKELLRNLVDDLL